VKIAVAIGDPNGIGPEIAVKAAALFTKQSAVEVILVGDRHVIEHYGKPSTLFAVDALSPEAFSPGTLDPRAGRATVQYLRAAVNMVERGAADAIIACPQSETAINRAGIPFDGYAGLLAELTGTPRDKTFLMLVAAGLRIAHVTLHESVASALKRITRERVVDAGVAAVRILERLKIGSPKLGVFGINPHAGEDGLFGDEDERITRPAVAELRRRGIAADGPVGADLLLSQRRHDAYLAMFHDQGHIPVKLLSPLRSSALSIGTPVLFSSVGHGCAFDIAGKGVADATSVVETLKLLGGVSQPAPPIAQ
jgi:4-hydroxy-L-threonine phosphate dehydrogenase PdxA